MTRRLTGRTASAACLLLAVSISPAGADSATDTKNGGTPETVRDLMIQNVCLDASGGVLPGRSPAESDPECAAQRDLRPGERLPYHKHDHPSPDQAAGAPLGYQRHDSYPVETAGAGVVVEHSFDFGAGKGRRFGRFDSGSDGGDVAILSDGRASLGATEDGGTGFMLWTG